MASDLITNLAGLFTKDRYLELNDLHQHASDIQHEQLFDTLRSAENTVWGQTYDFKSIISYQDFRERLPVTTAAAFKPTLQRLREGESNLCWPGLPKQLLTSYDGSTLPISEQALAETHTQGAYDSYVIHLNNHPNSRLFGGFFVHLGNEGEAPFMDEFDDFLRRNEPFILTLLNRPKFTGMLTLSDNQLLQLIKEMRNEKVSCFKGSPSGLARLAALAGEEEAQNPTILAEAEVLFHRTTRTNQELRQLDNQVRLSLPVQRIFCSPEGLIGLQDKSDDDSYLMSIDLSQFYEFIDDRYPERAPIPLDDIEPGCPYRLVLTTCSGLWRYVSDGPRLQFTSRAPYRFILV